MPKAPTIRVRLSDESTLELPENELVQVVTAGPADKPQEGWQKLATVKGKKAQYGKLAKVRAAALAQGQQLVTYRGVFEIESARRA